MGRIALITTVLVALLAAAAPVGAQDDPYSLSARALLGPAGTDVYITVSSATQPLPQQFEKIQVKAWPLDEGDVATHNYFDVPAPGGVATVHLAGLVRLQRLEIRAHVKDGNQNNLEAETQVLLRPDLVVSAIAVPPDVVRRHPFDVAVTVAERAGDTGASATVTLFDDSISIGSSAVEVAAGATSTVSFRVELHDHGVHHLSAEITAANPFESDESNNTARLDLLVHRYESDGAVSTDHPLATGIGEQILRAGGNAFDAAAAVLFALNVTQPHLAGIGGGSNVVVYVAAENRAYAIDARERAPAATTATTYSGRSVADVGPNGYAVGVPGTLRAVEVMLQRWGTKSLAETLDPAIQLAENGFPVGWFLATASADPRSRVQPETNALFHRADGSPLQIGDDLRQPDLAKTFRLIAQDGPSVFYRGEIASAVVAAQQRATTPGREGRMTLDDLARYDVVVSPALDLDYRGYNVFGATPSTNGGLVVLESLGLIERFPIGDADAGYAFGTPKTVHAMVESLRLALADRDMWIGDPAVFQVPVSGLLSDAYLADRSGLIHEFPLRMPGFTQPGNPLGYQAGATPDELDASDGGHTTHFSIIDKDGNVVSFTTTLADAFGSGITVPGYGFVLNDSLTLFNLTPRAGTGNPGANDAGPNKRPMGSMAPIVITKDGEPFAATGTYGAAFIPSLVFNMVLDLVDHHLSLQQAVDASRIWTRNDANVARTTDGNFAWSISLNGAPAITQATIDALRTIGHVVGRNPSGATFGSLASVGVDLDTFALHGAADGRQMDATAVVVSRH
jgi:gamma-glutamyltranspeptidase / glutathione hydrolase